MPLNYQTDSYILYNESFGNNQLEHQELLVATLKQLAEENRRLLKEREQFERERLEKKIELDNLKQNFLNLLTVAQHEFNPKNCLKNEIINEKLYFEIISKELEVNRQHFKNINLMHELKLDFLVQLLKNNSKITEYMNNFNNTFDCRPYKGPKTPPTPSQKFRFDSSNANKNYHVTNSQRISMWNIKDMMFYIKKYKDIFQIYKNSRSQLNSAYSQHLKMNYNNVFDGFAFENSRNPDTEKFISNDMEFYQDLIDKHQKSLEMIENVGNKIHPNLSLPNGATIQLNPLTNPMSDLLNINNLRSQIFNQFSTHLNMKTPLTLTDTKYPNNFPSVITNPNEILFLKPATTEQIKDSQISGILAERKENLKTEQCINSSPTDVSQKINKSLNNEISPDSYNIFEEGEIVDSGDELSTTKKSNEQIVNNNQIEKKASDKAIKSAISSKMKHSSRYHSIYSKYTKSWKYDKTKLSNSTKVVGSKNFNRKDHSAYYSSDNLRFKINRNSPRKELSIHKYSNRYSQNTRRYSPKY